MKKLLLLFAAVAFAFTGCYENTGPDTPNVGDITLSYNFMNVDAMGGDFSVDVTADYPFEASTNADWIYITAIGRYTLSFIVAENSTNAEREGTITIFCDSYDLSATLTITQKGRETSPNNEIWYTSSDGSVVKPYRTDAFGANIVSNTYANGKGVIVFDAPVTSIGSFAFSGCTSLTSVTIPDGVTSIRDSAFEDCTSLTSITIPDGVTSIGDWAFFDCISLKAFYGKFASSDNRCLIVDGVLTSFAPAGLTEYTIPDSVTSIGGSAFWCCNSLTSVIIPDSVISIGGSAFAGCTSLTSITIGDSVTSIGECAFADCTSLTSVTIPDSVTSIGEWAFSDCTSLTSVTIGDSVTSIGNNAFAECNSLTSVYCKPTTPPTAVLVGDEWNAFNNNASGRKIYVPLNSVDAYKAAMYWSYYADSIVGYDF